MKRQLYTALIVLAGFIITFWSCNKEGRLSTTVEVTVTVEKEKSAGTEPCPMDVLMYIFTVSDTTEWTVLDYGDAYRGIITKIDPETGIPLSPAVTQEYEGIGRINAYLNLEFDPLSSKTHFLVACNTSKYGEDNEVFAYRGIAVANGIDRLYLNLGFKAWQTDIPRYIDSKWLITNGAAPETIGKINPRFQAFSNVAASPITSSVTVFAHHVEDTLAWRVRSREDALTGKITEIDPVTKQFIRPFNVKSYDYKSDIVTDPETGDTHLEVILSDRKQNFLVSVLTNEYGNENLVYGYRGISVDPGEPDEMNITFRGWNEQIWYIDSDWIIIDGKRNGEGEDEEEEEEEESAQWHNRPLNGPKLR